MYEPTREERRGVKEGLERKTGVPYDDMEDFSQCLKC